jgi:SAM-dependent methyltransferase
VFRSIQPEILDSLPHDSPLALRNRRDLRVINFLMGAERWFGRTLRRVAAPRDSFLEIGAGTGDLGRALARTIAPVRYTGLDLWPRPADWPDHWRWLQTDLLDFQNYAGESVVFGNLILHQFTAEELAGVGRIMQRHARAIVFSEPARRRLHVWQLRLISLLGLSAVAKHDGLVSIQAGFLGEELPMALGLDRRDWKWTVTTGFRGYYRMVAVRRSRPGRK